MKLTGNIQNNVNNNAVGILPRYRLESGNSAWRWALQVHIRRRVYDAFRFALAVCCAYVVASPKLVMSVKVTSYDEFHVASLISPGLGNYLVDMSETFTKFGIPPARLVWNVRRYYQGLSVFYLY